MKGTGSKSVKRNKSSKKIVDAGNHPVPSMGVQQTSTISNPNCVSGTEDAEQTTCDESESHVEENTTEKAERVSFSSNRSQLARSKH